MSGLDELNKLLAQEKLGLPAYRQTVDRSGRNLSWLKRAVKKHPDASDRLRELVNKPIGELC